MFQAKVVCSVIADIFCSVTFLSVYEIMQEVMAGWGRPQVAIENGSCALRAGNVRLHKYAKSVGIYCFPTATVVTVTPFDMSVLRTSTCIVYHF
jgi:hypothetical protein